MGDPTTLDDIQKFSADLEKRKAELNMQLEVYRADKRKLQRMIMAFQGDRVAAYAISPDERRALREIRDTGKRDYAAITKILFKKDTPKNRRETYKAFNRWKEAQLVRQRDGVWEVHDATFFDDEDVDSGDTNENT